jgi:hypothetical protein
MPVDRSFLAEANEARARLHRLLARLSDVDLQRQVGPDWTIAGMLAHVAFYEYRALVLLDEWNRSGYRDSPLDAEVTNRSALPQWLALPPRVAAQQALDAAEAVDQRLAALSDELVEAISTGAAGIQLNREHRTEHLDEIERVLGGAG